MKILGLAKRAVTVNALRFSVLLAAAVVVGGIWIIGNSYRGGSGFATGAMQSADWHAHYDLCRLPIKLDAPGTHICIVGVRRAAHSHQILFVDVIVIGPKSSAQSIGALLSGVPLFDLLSADQDHVFPIDAVGGGLDAGSHEMRGRLWNFFYFQDGAVSANIMPPVDLVEILTSPSHLEVWGVTVALQVSTSMHSVDQMWIQWNERGAALWQSGGIGTASPELYQIE